MITAAWDRLVARGRLAQWELLEELNVKRSAFVCALLERFPDVEVEEPTSAATQPITLIMPRKATVSAPPLPPVLGQPNRATESQTPEAIFAARLNDLFLQKPYSTEDFADALADAGVVMAAEIASRLTARKGGVPSDSIIDALARVFDVDPEYFLTPPATDALHLPPGGPSESSTKNVLPPESSCTVHTKRDAENVISHVSVELREFGRLVAALPLAVGHYLAQPDADISTAAALIRSMSVLAQHLRGFEGRVAIPRTLVEEITLAWARTGPSDSPSHAEFLWFAELLGRTVRA